MAKPTQTAPFEPNVAETAGGFTVGAGKRRISTAPGVPLVLPTRSLAEAIRDEWKAAGPRTRLGQLRLGNLAAATAAAMVDRTHIEDTLLSYAETDLVCYWSGDEAPEPLRGRQASAWQPMLDWARTTLDADLKVARAIVPMRQDAATLAALRAAVASLSPAELIALRMASAVTGSLVIGLGLVRGAWDADRAHAAAIVDERFQMERWGIDLEAEVALEAKRRDLADAARFLQLSREA